jgi:hypothetical protein
MIQPELIERSPLRILEQSTRGGLGKGNIGVIAASKGIGKTACLINIAADHLFQGKHVIHASFTETTDHIIAWYEDIFNELKSRYRLDDALQIHDDWVKNRIIMNFNLDTFNIREVENRIRILNETCNFHIDTLVIDGYAFERTSLEDLQEFKHFAEELHIEIWFSAAVPDSEGYFDGSSIPAILEPLTDTIAIIICLQPMGRVIHLNLVKDHDTEMTGDPHLKLDPKILLIAEEK